MRRSVILAVGLLVAACYQGAAFGQAPNNGQIANKKTASGPGPKTAAEQQAVQAMLQAQTPDDVIKGADNLVTKFPNTDFKAFALERQAEAWQQKGDNAKAIVFGEQALMADPKNFDALNLLANVIAATTRDTDLDKDEKLAKAEKYAHDSIDILNSGEKPWMYQEPQWQKVKAGALGQAYQALGNAALVRKKNDDAVANFQKGVDASQDPLLEIRLGRALYTEKKYDEAITWDDKVINSADTPAQYKNIAQNDKTRAAQAKAGK
jgi:tetratricopeptide (TPR) repeat protein